MKGLLLSFLLFGISLTLQAQILNPGGGQLDLTKKEINKHEFKIFQNKFSKKVEERWSECKISFPKKSPSSLSEFFMELKDQKISYSPDELLREKQSCCSDLSETKYKMQPQEFQCIVQDNEMQSMFNFIVHHKKEIKGFIDSSVIKLSKQQFTSKDAIIFFEKIIIKD